MLTPDVSDKRIRSVLMGKINKLVVLATISDSKTNPRNKEAASMVLTIIMDADGYLGLAYKKIQSRSIEVYRIQDLRSNANKILFSFDMGIDITDGIEMVACEIAEHKDSSFIWSVAHTNLLGMNDAYTPLDGDKEVYVTHGESKDFVLDGKPLECLKHRLEESIWVK